MFPVQLNVAGIDLDEVLAGGPAAGRLIKSVKEQLASVPNKGVGYSLLHYLNRSARADLPGAMPGQISFNYLGQITSADLPPELIGVGWTGASDVELTAGIDPDMAAAASLDINSYVADGVLDTTIGFPAGLFAEADVQELAALWLEALGGIAAHANTPNAGGFTPSDFPLVKVTQGDIEMWEKRYGLGDVWPLAPLQGGMLFHATACSGVGRRLHLAVRRSARR